MLREWKALGRLATRQPIEQKGIKTIHDIFTQPLHCFVTDPSSPVPRTFTIGADDFHIGIVARLRAWEDAGVEILQRRVPHAMEGEHLGKCSGSMVEIRVGHRSSSRRGALVLGQVLTLLGDAALR